MTGEIGPELVQRTLYECPNCGKRFSTEGIYASHYRSMCAEVPGQDARSLLGEYVRLKDNGECGRVITADVRYLTVRTVHAVRNPNYRAICVFDTYIHVNRLERISVREAETIVRGLCSDMVDFVMRATDPKAKGARR